jgi:hypothetical protein
MDTTVTITYKGKTMEIGDFSLFIAAISVMKDILLREDPPEEHIAGDIEKLMFEMHRLLQFLKGDCDGDCDNCDKVDTLQTIDEWPSLN